MDADADGLAGLLVQAVRCGADAYADALLLSIVKGDEAKYNELRQAAFNCIPKINWDTGEEQAVEQFRALLAAEIERFKNGTNPGN